MFALRPYRHLGVEDIPLPAVIGSFRVMRDCNQQYCDLFGYERSNMIGKSFRMIYLDNSEYIRSGKLWKTQLDQHHFYVDERIMIKATGEKFWCRVYGRALDKVNPMAHALWLVQPLHRAVATTTGPALTMRQRQIVALVAQGKSNAEIAEEVGLSVRTAETHRTRIMRKVGVRNAAELSAWFAGSQGHAPL